MSCPICKKPAHPRYRPFCSRRCADIDLGKWLTGAYAIPSDEPDDIWDGAGDQESGSSEKVEKPH